MPISFEWKPNYSVSVSRFDSEHRKLLSFARSLHNVIIEPVAAYTIVRALMEFTAYMRAHLAGEEDLLRRCEYPEYKQHQRKHENFRRRMDGFEKRVLDGNAKITVGLMRSLAAGMTNHILSADSRYGDFFNMHGMY